MDMWFRYHIYGVISQFAFGLNVNILEKMIDAQEVQEIIKFFEV